MIYYTTKRNYENKYCNCTTSLHILSHKMLTLFFEEFNVKFGIDNKAMGKIRIEHLGKDISVTPIEIVMRDQKPDNTSEPNWNIIINLHPTDGTRWVLVLRRGGLYITLIVLVLRLHHYS